MTKKKKYIEPKPIEEWDVKDWETAYNNLNAKYDKLKDRMRRAMNDISHAQQQLSEAVI